MEADLSQEEKVKMFGMAERMRKAKNELTSVMQKRLDQLWRRRRYKGLIKALANCSNKEERKRIESELEDLREQEKVTWDACRKEMISIAKRYNLPSVFGTTGAEDVWKGVADVLFRKGKRLGFLKRGELPGLRAKEPNRIIVMKAGECSLSFKMGDLCFGLKKQPGEWDRFEEDEIVSILSWMNHAEEFEKEAIALWKSENHLLDTFRPCYCTIVCREIRGKLRVFIHITLEGKPSVKFTKDGRVRHIPGKGRVGADIGTSSVAWTSDDETGIDNLAVRGEAALRIEEKIRKLNQAIDRSKRLSNPQNFNPDGTCKRGRHKWVHSNRCRHLMAKVRALSRKASINRHLAVNEMVNHFRTLGDTFITETKNAARLAKRAKKTTFDKNGRPRRKKRFGKSIQKRIPGYMQEKAKEVFERTGGTYIEVPNMYRASQYDFTDDSYHKKSLGTRRFKLSDGREVLRDWIASFNLYCADGDYAAIDRMRCICTFDDAWRMHNDMIWGIELEGKKVLNSGIRIAGK